ncbi:MAG: uracil-DNA glycosylase family protein [Acidobacteriota bacterium]|jgi:DNA polymerase
MKQAAYQALVAERKACTLCKELELTNPASAALCHLDSNQIGPWTRWQGDLDADIMVVAQDWGDVESFKRQSGKDNESPTNRMLIKLLDHVGVRVTSPLASRQDSGVFLTNAVLCLKHGNAQTAVSKQWYANCGPKFLRRQIEIVRPRVVVTLGEWAYKTTMHSFELEPRRFRDAVNSVDAVELFQGTCLVPVYHCGPKILNTRVRDREAQFKDWMRVRHALTGNIPDA